MLSTLSTLLTASGFVHCVHIVHRVMGYGDQMWAVRIVHKAFRIRREGEGVGPGAKGLLKRRGCKNFFIF